MDEKITGMPDGLPSPYRRDGYEHPFWLAGYKAGREQGMREAAEIVAILTSTPPIVAPRGAVLVPSLVNAILSAIGEGK